MLPDFFSGEHIFATLSVRLCVRAFMRPFGNSLPLYNFWTSGAILITFYRFVYLTKKACLRTRTKSLLPKLRSHRRFKCQKGKFTSALYLLNQQRDFDNILQVCVSDQVGLSWSTTMSKRPMSRSHLGFKSQQVKFPPTLSFELVEGFW